jgi:hypothetical protein
MIHRVFILGPCSQPSNPQNRARKYAQDRSKLFSMLLFVAIANVAALHTKLFSFSSHHGRFFRPLSHIVISVTTVRRHDISLPSNYATVFTTQRPTSWPCWAPCCLHQIPRWINDRYNPAVVIKGNPLPRAADAKAPFSIRARQYHCSCSSSS